MRSYQLDIEEISMELDGVQGIITALQIAAAGDVLPSAEVLSNYLYGVQTHLDRIIRDIDAMIDIAVMEKQRMQKSDNK